MILDLYIGNLLIDSVDVDIDSHFVFCKTLAERENRIEELKSLLCSQHSSKLLIAEAEARFVLLADSKANKIIRDDRFENSLLEELKNDLKQKPLLKICR